MDSLREQLELLGLELDQRRLQRLWAACEERGFDAEEAAEQWAASVLSDASGDVDKLLNKFERMHSKPPTQTPTCTTTTTTTRSIVHISNNEDILTDYLSTTTPKVYSMERKRCDETMHLTRRKSVIIINLDNEDFDCDTSQLDGSTISLCPATYSTTTPHSEKYTSRTNSGDVLNSYGNEDALQKCTWTNMSEDTCHVQQVPNHSNTILTSKAMYGFELLQNKASVLDSNIKYLSQCILHKVDIKETVSVIQKNQVPISIVGRIDCDSNGRLNTKSVVLQGTWDQSFGHNVAVDLDQLNQYTLFPGQVVAMTGLNLHGNRFIAQEVFTDASQSKPSPPILENTISDALQIVTVCGPFTTSDSLGYDPLTDLIQYIVKHKPHVAILIGPFLDANHPLVLQNTIAVTYKSYFENLVEKIMTAIPSSHFHTQIVMVASSRDVFHTNVYPTPPFSIKKTYSNLTLAPDPCVLNVSGVNIGITATDILMHLSKEEISMPPQGQDKIGRLASQILHQQNFYPLQPPNPCVSLDTTLWNDYAALPFTPHLLVVPSDFRYFTKNINGCVIVNPERLTKGNGGGTFARIQVNPQNNDENIFCQILRI